MKFPLIPFICGAAVGAVAASAAWSLSTHSSGGSPAREPVDAAPPAEAPAAVEAAPAPIAVSEPAEPVAETAPETAQPEPAAPALAESAPPPRPAPPAEGEPGARQGPPRWDEMTDEQREEMRQRFRRMHDEHSMRVVNSFVEKNALDESDGETLLAIADGMNERALARMQVWSDYIQLKGADRIPKDQAARLMSDLFGELADSYGEMDKAFGTEWREKDPDFDLGRMVDPEVFGTMFRLAGGFGGRGPGGPRGGGRGPRPPAGNGGPPAAP